MWENRCKVAVSGVGFSQVTRSADIPLAAHALTAVKEAVADSGLEMSDIDGLATYPELPATGHAEVDGISVVSVNCMMAMLKLPDLSWHIQVGTTNIGGAVQQAVNALLAGVCCLGGPIRGWAAEERLPVYETPAAPNKGILRVFGAGLHGLVNEWEAAYVKHNPNVKIADNPGGSDAGSGGRPGIACRRRRSLSSVGMLARRPRV